MAKKHRKESAAQKKEAEVNESPPLVAHPLPKNGPLLIILGGLFASWLLFLAYVAVVVLGS